MKALIIALFLAVPVLAQNTPTFITYQVPGNFTIYPHTPINEFLAVAGSFISSNYHGFVRSGNGTFTSFDPPGSVYTFVSGMSPSEVITGMYQASDGVPHGFVRSPAGTITGFDAPGVSTMPIAVNFSGAIAGSCLDANNASHGFVRSPDGTLTPFDPPGSTNTYPQSINAAGAIAGYYVSAAHHGFVRAPDGTVTSFDPPGSISTQVWSINKSGAAAGYYVDGSDVSHGFVRAPDGTITPFDPPGSIHTEPRSINLEGAIAGVYSNGALHGFVRSPKGTFTSFDVPGCNGIITPRIEINELGIVAGVCSNESIGFLGLP